MKKNGINASCKEIKKADHFNLVEDLNLSDYFLTQIISDFFDKL